jgi:hypothetical protein
VRDGGVLTDTPDFDKISALIHRPVVSFPWDGVSEDRWSCNDAIYTLYSSLQLAKPRIAWAPSPRSLFRATRMLREIQAGTAWAMVQALVPRDPNTIEREARIALLTAMIDPDVTTQSGGLLTSMIWSVFGKSDHHFYPVIYQIANLLRFRDEKKIGDMSTPATFAEQSLYPGLYSAFMAPRLNPISRQAILICPFARLCWLSRPPIYVRTDEFERLHCVDGPAVEWTDGFRIYVRQEEDGPSVMLADTEEKTLALGSGEEVDG